MATLATILQFGKANVMAEKRDRIRAQDDPFLLRALPNDAVYFHAKKIDNSRVVRQADPGAVFAGVAGPGERFDLTLCNPPFHGSLREAREGAQRKWRNLGRGTSERPVLNFGGRGVELWCEGGEAGFAKRLIAESAAIPAQVLWFTTLLSNSASLPAVHRALRRAGAQEIHTVPMAQGQKQSRFVAWTFLDAAQREAWRERWRSE